MSQASEPIPTRRSTASAVTLVRTRLAAERQARVQGLRGSSRAAYLAALYRAAPRPFLVLAADAGAAETLAADLHFFLGEEPGVGAIFGLVAILAGSWLATRGAPPAELEPDPVASRRPVPEAR